MQTEIVLKPTEELITRAANLLKAGGLVAFPTETVYGLGGNGLDAASAAKIYASKGRPSDNPLILHLSSAEQAEKYAYTCPMFYKLAMAFMPGPLTVILKKKNIVPLCTTGGLETVAVRVPAHPIAKALLEHCDFPVAAPSANISGRPSPTRIEHVAEDLSGKVDMILGGGECEIGVESTIVSIDGEHLTLLRPGAITPEMLAPFCASISLDPSLERPLMQGEAPLAPGMKYKHYAPKADVILLQGSDMEILSFMKREYVKDGVGILCSDEQRALLNGANVLSYGANPKDEARTLFACLRDFDHREDIKIIYAPQPKRDGIGLAVYNRLAKAAGFTVKNIKEF